ncbi:MAG: radical SAM family heme chaperone HemW [Bacilli bacterium]|nr:radical SAM family heme chaperone HemW [Bacilli bacterium]
MIKAVYIHIPFCDHICSYCDFPKILSETNYQKEYLNSLKKEIETNYRNEIIETIYIGGGTPSSLSLTDLKYLLDILTVFKTRNLEYTMEVNIESIDKDKLKLMKKYGINRISIGIETFNDKYLKFLNRNYTKKDIKPKIELIKKYFSNINVDLMYAFPNQTIKELEEDIDAFLDLNINHISTYSLIIEPNTVLYNKNTENIDEDLDYKMYELITNKLSKYHHYEISNFAKTGFESKHNLVYWHNENYYGFGLGAAGYIDNIRYTNTRSINNYFKGNYILDKHKLDKKETMSNEFMLGLRLIDGIDITTFKDKYKMDIKNYKNIKELLELDKLKIENNRLFINPKYIYISNSILVDLI